MDTVITAAAAAGTGTTTAAAAGMIIMTIEKAGITTIIVGAAGAVVLNFTSGSKNIPDDLVIFQAREVTGFFNGLHRDRAAK